MPRPEPATGNRLRVVDLGAADPARSQAVWHAIAQAVGEGRSPVTLSFVRPASPYVGIGYHRRQAEVDQEFCRRKNWPILRRKVGGGVVFLDRDQLFFQISQPVSDVSAFRVRALADMLAPSITAYRAAGVDARLDSHGEIVEGARKVCGHAAGQIEDGVVAVGNLIEAFDANSAASVVSVPHPQLTPLLARWMAAVVGPAPGRVRPDPVAFVNAAVAAYGEALRREPSEGLLSDYERELTESYCDELARADDLVGPPANRSAWQLKIKGDTHLAYAGESGSGSLAAVVVEGIVAEVQVFDSGAPRPGLVEELLVGVTPAEAASRARKGREHPGWMAEALDRISRLEGGRRVA